MLPTAQRMDYLATLTGTYFAFTAAANPGSPCLFQWGNDFAWYTRSERHLSRNWNVSGWTKVLGVLPFPNRWDGCPPTQSHTPESVLLVLEGCRDTQGAPLGIFPETLKGELHGVRSVIEAHSNSGRLEPVTDGTPLCQGTAITNQACAPNSATVRVVDKHGYTNIYTIDRWD